MQKEKGAKIPLSFSPTDCDLDSAEDVREEESPDQKRKHNTNAQTKYKIKAAAAAEEKEEVEEKIMPGEKILSQEEVCRSGRRSRRCKGRGEKSEIISKKSCDNDHFSFRQGKTKSLGKSLVRS